jgi:hypothetical protein
VSGIKGFVYIVESPSPDDLLDSRTEGRVLSEALDLAGIKRFYHLATSEEMFKKAIWDRLIECWKKVPDLNPIIHLSMHGNGEGIQLTDGTFIKWSSLRGILKHLTEAMEGRLLICMSSCFGGSGCRMAMHADADHPFWALVGHSDSAAWSDAAVGYVTFYHLFFKGIPLNKCVEAMRAASGDQRFMVFHGAELKKNWADWAKSDAYRNALVAALRNRPGQGLLSPVALTTSR